MKIVVTFLLALLVTACAAPVARIENTPSGRPEVQIENVDLDAVRERLIERVMAAGFTLDADTPTRIVVSKQMQGMQESVMRLALSNSYSTPVRLESAFTLVRTAVGVRIYAQLSASSTMPLGQVRRMDIDDNNNFNSMQDSLNRLRDSFKAQSAPARAGAAMKS